VADALVLGRLMTNLLRMRNAALVDEASSVANAEAPVEF
jgi:hypothetical protein